MGKKATRQKAKAKPQKPSIKIPASPCSASKTNSAAPPDNGVISPGSNSNLASPFQTPPTSPSTLATELPSMDSALPKNFETQDGKSENENEKLEEGAQVEPSPDQPRQSMQEQLQHEISECEKLEGKVQDQLPSPDQTQQPTQEHSQFRKDSEQQQFPVGDAEGPQLPLKEQEVPITTPGEEVPRIHAGGELQLQGEEDSNSQTVDQESLRSPALIQQDSELPGGGQELSLTQEIVDLGVPTEDSQPRLEEKEQPVQAPETGEGHLSSSPQGKDGLQSLPEARPISKDNEQLQPSVQASEPGAGKELSSLPQEQDDPQSPAEDPMPTYEDREQSQSSVPCSPTQSQQQLSSVLKQEQQEMQPSLQEEAQNSLQDDTERPVRIELQAPTPTQEQRSPEEEGAETQDLHDADHLETPLQEHEQALEQDTHPDDCQQQSPEPEWESELDIDLATQQQQSPTETCGTPISAIAASDVASKDIMAIAGVLSTMKTALVSMANAFDRLGDQTEKMVRLALDLKATEQIRRLQSALEQQIAKHKVEVELLQSSLKTKIKEAVEEKIRTELLNIVRETVQQEIEEKVRYQLSIQIPEDLRQQVISHQRQILEVKTTLHNSEARRHNALQTIPGPHARLRPLLRPLPTPEQSPIMLMSRSSSMDPSTLPTPATAFPQVPAPTPIKRVSSSSLRSALVSETVPPTPSRLFPRDLTALFALSQEEARRLLREYGLDSATASPTKESARPRALSIVNEEGVDAMHDEDPAAHARDLNKFMAHIGVPFLMIPAPQEKISRSAPLSSKSRRKLLTPLIIK